MKVDYNSALIAGDQQSNLGQQLSGLYCKHITMIISDDGKWCMYYKGVTALALPYPVPSIMIISDAKIWSITHWWL